jgi:hypothetical protein
MQKRNFVLILCLLAAATSLAWSASLEEAQSLESRGRRDAALEEIDDILTSDAPAEEMAGALDLLGTIAVDEGDLHLAYQSWSRLVGEYPDFAKALGATTKLSLVISLMEAKGESPTLQAEAPSKPGQESAAVTPQSSPAQADRDDTPARTVAPTPTAASAPVQDQAAKTDSVPSSQRSEPAPTSGTVLVAVSGKPYDAAVEAGEMVITFLREQGVDAVSATEGIPVVRDASALVPVMVQRARDQGATSALLVDAEFPGRQKVSAQCYSPDGAQYWKTKVSGGTGWTGRDFSKSGVNVDLVERFNKKLTDLVGGPGLPVTLN